MSQYQKEDIKNIIKKNDNEKILRKIIKNDRRSKQYNSRKTVDKSITSLPSKETYIRLGKKNFPTFKIISTNKLRMNKLNNKSFYKFNTLNRFSVSNLNKINNKLINNKLIELKNYGSTKDIYRTTIQDNHSLFISGPLETPHPSHKIKFETENNNKLIKNTLNKGIEEANSIKKQTTILYKRRNDNNEKKNYSSIYSTLNNVNKTSGSSSKTNNNIMDYKINSITYKNSTNKKSEIKQKNITEISSYIKDNQTYNSKGNRLIFIAPKKIESRFRTDDDYIFNPKNDLSVDNDNLLYHRLKRNETMVKKFRLLSFHNSSLGRNFFFNPLSNNLKNDISSFTNSINQSKDKNKIDSKKYIIRKSESNSGLRITLEPKKATVNDSKLNYKDRRLYKTDLTKNKIEWKKFDLTKKNIIKIGNNKNIKIKNLKNTNKNIKNQNNLNKK